MYSYKLHGLVWGKLSRMQSYKLQGLVLGKLSRMQSYVSVFPLWPFRFFTTEPWYSLACVLLGMVWLKMHTMHCMMYSQVEEPRNFLPKYENYGTFWPVVLFLLICKYIFFLCNIFFFLGTNATETVRKNPRTGKDWEEKTGIVLFSKLFTTVG